MATTSTGITPEKLPPTQSSAKFHCWRVHLQIMLWEALDTSVFEGTEWGWKKTDSGLLQPIPSDQPVAPENLLKFVRCRCKM